MPSSIISQIKSIWATLYAAYQVSKQGVSRRYRVGLMELVPQILFYLAQGAVVLSVFRQLNGMNISTEKLIAFLLAFYTVDALGDAFIFKGISEYASALRRSNTSYYSLAPGIPVFKVIFLRWDVPLVSLGGLMACATIIFGARTFDAQPVLLVAALALGTTVHIVLTSAFFIIQAYIDPTMPIAFGNPASRYFMRPLHMIIGSGVGLVVLTTIYPVFFATAVPAAIASNDPLPFSSFVRATMVAILMLAAWLVVLNTIVAATCRKTSS